MTKYCPFIPEELFIAGGFLPFRMRGTGSHDTNLADAYFDSLNYCFVRHTFNQLLSGKYRFLDGLVIGTGCDHLRRIYDNARHAAHQTAFIHLLDHPRTMGTPDMNIVNNDVVVDVYTQLKLDFAALTAKSFQARLNAFVENKTPIVACNDDFFPELFTAMELPYYFSVRQGLEGAFHIGKGPKAVDGYSELGGSSSL